MYSNRPIYILFLLIVTISTLAYYCPTITIQPLTDNNLITLPIAIKNRILHDPAGEFMYIYKHGNNVQYFFCGKAVSRAELIINILKKTISPFGYNIPDGEYLMSMHDGAHRSIGWPILAFSGDKQLVANSQTVLMPDPEAIEGYNLLFDNIRKNLTKYSWAQKISKIFWRGKTTGLIKNMNDLNGFARIRFINYSADLDFVDAGFTGYPQLNPEFVNYISTIDRFALKKTVSPADSIAYKYLIDIDGNSCSYSRMAWILYSNSVLFKHQSSNIQWYYDRLKPYVHYIPIAEDFSNLAQQFAWAEANQDKVQQIIRNANVLAKITFGNYSIKMSIVRSLQKYHEIVNKLEAEATIANT